MTFFNQLKSFIYCPVTLNALEFKHRLQLLSDQQTAPQTGQTVNVSTDAELLERAAALTRFHCQSEARRSESVQSVGQMWRLAAVIVWSVVSNVIWTSCSTSFGTCCTCVTWICGTKLHLTAVNQHKPTYFWRTHHVSVHSGCRHLHRPVLFCRLSLLLIC